MADDNPRRKLESPVDRARRLRRESNPAEQRLWGRLRGRALNGLRFRRQHPIGPFYADFCCSAAHLVVEVDGDTHGERVDDDARRTAWLERQGYQVVRVTNEDVYRRIESVLETIRVVCERRVAAREGERRIPE